MTNKRASLSTFRANDHARLPGEEEPQAPVKKRLIDKHFRVTPEAARAFNLLAAQLYSGEGSAAWAGPDSRGAQHAF